MKTGTITFHAPNNNGSFLQAYALQNVLTNELKVDNEIIDFYSEKQARQYSVFRKIQSAGDAARNLVSLAHYRALASRFRRFQDIRVKYLKLSERCTTPDEVYSLADRYDTIICGSDQIWNTKARDYSDAYFMPGVNKKKISYAASFGSHIAKDDSAKIAGYLDAFSHISVREEEGRRFLEGVLKGKANESVCDPTLLLDKSCYNSLIGTEAIVPGRFILLYTISYSEEALAIAKGMSEYLGIPVYAPFTGYSCVKCRKYGIKVLYDVGPAQFLWLVEHAEYVCSNSFHGVAFSVIFGKQFFRPIGKNADGTQPLDDRIDSLLDRIKLNRRNVNCQTRVEEELQNPIDFRDVHMEVRRIREQGIRFLENALKDE